MLVIGDKKPKTNITDSFLILNQIHSYISEYAGILGLKPDLSFVKHVFCENSPESPKKGNSYMILMTWEETLNFSKVYPKYIFFCNALIFSTKFSTTASLNSSDRIPMFAFT